jgi:hypothetical protein
MGGLRRVYRYLYRSRFAKLVVRRKPRAQAKVPDEARYRSRIAINVREMDG